MLQCTEMNMWLERFWRSGLILAKSPAKTCTLPPNCRRWVSVIFSVVKKCEEFRNKRDHALMLACTFGVRDEGHLLWRLTELFFFTFIYVSGNRASTVEKYLKKSLADLELSYIDLYLIHTPFAVPDTDGDFHRQENGDLVLDTESNHVETWKVHLHFFLSLEYC